MSSWSPASIVRMPSTSTIPFDRAWTPIEPSVVSVTSPWLAIVPPVGATKMPASAVSVSLLVGAAVPNASAVRPAKLILPPARNRSEEHTSELQSLMRISYAVFCLKKKRKDLTKATLTKRYHKQVTSISRHRRPIEED